MIVEFICEPACELICERQFIKSNLHQRMICDKE